MQKRIAMISYHTCPLASQEGKETGGMNVYVLELGRELARMGHVVDVFTRSQDSRNEAVVQVEERLRVMHIMAGPQAPISKKKILPYIPEFVSNYFEYCRRVGVEHTIVHAHYYLSGLIAQEIRKRERRFERVPFIQSFHTLALMKNLVARDDAEKEERERIDAEMHLSKIADRIVVPSVHEKEYLTYFYDAPERHIAVIPPGVNHALFRPMDKNSAKAHIGVPNGSKLILFVGRIEPLKGIDLLLYAMKIVTKRNPDIPICLCIVGGDVSEPRTAWTKTLQSLDALRHTLHLSTTVQFIGQKVQEVLPYYYNAAEVVVMPSHYESFGMTALEAMSCGIPVITTNVTGISSIIDQKHRSLVTTVNNPLLLARQIEHILHNPETHKDMREDIRNRVADLSWASTAGKMSTLYESILS